MGPEWILIGLVAVVGIGAAVLVAFYRKLSAIERSNREHRHQP